ncbi:Isoleucine--tRNA ligase [compost metagenome]
MLNGWYQGLSELPEGTELDRAYWDRVMAVKASVNKELENQRTAKVIGGNLQAEVTLFAEEGLSADLSKLGDELRFVLITSAASVVPFAQAPADAVATEVEGLKLKVVKSGHAKCGRCWHFRADVGSHPEHPEICSRCVDNLSGSGEVRHYA